MSAHMIRRRAVSGLFTTIECSPIDGGEFRRLHVPTPRGIVRVWSWPGRTDFELIYAGHLFVRRHARSWSVNSLILRAGHFARQVERLAGGSD